MSDTTIQSDVVEDIDGAADITVEDILERWGVDEETPSTDVEDPPQGTKEVDGDEDDVDVEEEEVTEDPESVPEPEPPKEKRVVSEDDEVIVKVDGQETRVSVKDLSRLYGQEASLTRKSQELATSRKAAEEQGMVALGVLEKMYQKAVEKAKPYENIDLFTASRELETEEFNALRGEIARATEEKRFYEQELNGYVQSLRAQRENFIREQAGNALAIVKSRIPTWDDKTYDDTRLYAIEQGMHPDSVNQIVDPAALVMIHKARLYDKAKAKAATKTSPVTKPTGVNTARPSAAPLGNGNRTAKSKSWDRFSSTGSSDDAVAALVARWNEQT